MGNCIVLLKTAFWLALAALALLGLKPAPPELLFDSADKLYHALGFCVLTLLGGIAYPKMSPRRLSVIVMGIGILIEWGQLMAPARTASASDLLANLAGFAVGAVVLWMLRGRQPINPAQPLAPPGQPGE